MARLESEIKGGFYPTPKIEMEHILQFISPEEDDSHVTIIDPCAGEGDALKQLGDHFPNRTTYAIELEKSRADKCVGKADYVLKCAYENTRISHDAFSLMYLNPPFAEVQGKRLEEIFLKDLTKDYLSQDGVLIFNLPQNVLGHVAKVLSTRFYDIKVRRFSDANYDRFKQVIVFGKRRRKGMRTKKDLMEQERIERELTNYSFLGKDALLPLDETPYENERYCVDEPLKSVGMFDSTIVEREDILKASQDVFQKAEDLFQDLQLDSHVKITPASTLKETHLAAAIASGALPESMGDHLLIGVSKRVESEREELNSRTKKRQHITKMQPKTIVRVFGENGIFNLQ